MPVPSPHRACVLRLDAAHPDSGGRARADLTAGLGLWRLALSLALLDIRNRYRGSVLGPLWTTLSTLVMVAGLALLPAPSLAEAMGLAAGMSAALGAGAWKGKPRGQGG